MGRKGRLGVLDERPSVGEPIGDRAQSRFHRSGPIASFRHFSKVAGLRRRIVEASSTENKVSGPSAIAVDSVLCSCSASSGASADAIAVAVGGEVRGAFVPLSQGNRFPAGFCRRGHKVVPRE